MGAAHYYPSQGEPMNKQEMATELISFLTQDPTCQQCLSSLHPKAEIAIQVAQVIEIKVFYDGSQVCAVEQKASSPDFIFKASPEAIAIMIAENNLSPAQLGMKLIKQVLSGDITIAMPSNIFQVTRKGYFKIFTLGGRELLQALKQYDLASLPKIMAAVSKLKKK